MKTLFCTLAVTLILATPRLAAWGHGVQDASQPAAITLAALTQDVSPVAAPASAPYLERIFGALAAQDLSAAADSSAVRQDTQDERSELLEVRRRAEVLERVLAEQTARADQRVSREHELLQQLAEREVVMADELARRESELRALHHDLESHMQAEEVRHTAQQAALEAQLTRELTQRDQQLHALQMDFESRLHEVMAEHNLGQAEMQAVLAQELAVQQREMSLEQTQLETEMMRELAEREAEMIREQAELEREFHMQLAEHESELHRELAERDAERAELEILLRKEWQDAGQVEDEREARQLRRELERLRSRLESQTERLERARERERERQDASRGGRGRREPRPARRDAPEGFTGVIGVVGEGGGASGSIGVVPGQVILAPPRVQVGVAPGPAAWASGAGGGSSLYASPSVPRAQGGTSGGITIIVEKGDVYIQGDGKGGSIAPRVGSSTWSVIAPTKGETSYSPLPSPFMHVAPDRRGLIWSSKAYWQDEAKAKKPAKPSKAANSKAAKKKKKAKAPAGSGSVVWATSNGGRSLWSRTAPSPPTGSVTSIEIPEFEIEAFEIPEFEIEAFEIPEFEIEAFEIPEFDIEAFKAFEALGAPESYIKAYENLVYEGAGGARSAQWLLYTQADRQAPVEAVSYDPSGYLLLGSTPPKNADVLSEILGLVRELKADMSALREQVQDLHTEVARSPRRGGSR